MADVDQLEAMLTRGQDSPLLRYGLANAYLKRNDAARAAEHLRHAVRQDPHYSAAWKLLGKALTADGHVAEARQAFADGIRAAQMKGDKQAAREMEVFLRRLSKDQ